MPAVALMLFSVLSIHGDGSGSRTCSDSKGRVWCGRRVSFCKLASIQERCQRTCRACAPKANVSAVPAAPASVSAFPGSPMASVSVFPAPSIPSASAFRGAPKASVPAFPAASVSRASAFHSAPKARVSAFPAALKARMPVAPGDGSRTPPSTACSDQKGRVWCERKVLFCKFDGIRERCRRTCRACAPKPDASAFPAAPKASVSALPGSPKASVSVFPAPSISSVSAFHGAPRKPSVHAFSGSSMPMVPLAPDDGSRVPLSTSCSDQKDKEWCGSRVSFCNTSSVQDRCLRTCGCCFGTPSARAGVSGAHPSACSDKKGKEWCGRRVSFCNASAIRYRCQRTCDVCTKRCSPGRTGISSVGIRGTKCEDKKAKGWCTRNIVSCNESYIRERCQQTCRVCSTELSDTGVSKLSLACSDTASQLWCQRNIRSCTLSAVRYRCQKTCRVCAGTRTVGIRGTKCEDKKAKWWCNHNILSCNESFIRERCQQTCRVCSTEHNATGVSKLSLACSDTASQPWCQRNIRSCTLSAVRYRCQKTCRVCAGNRTVGIRSTKCEDKKAKWWCNHNILSCNESFIRERCQQTCRVCSTERNATKAPKLSLACVDSKSQEWCQSKIVGSSLRCNISFIRERCRRSCGICFTTQHLASGRLCLNASRGAICDETTPQADASSLGPWFEKNKTTQLAEWARILEKNEIRFIHIPKTGGTTIEHTIAPNRSLIFRWKRAHLTASPWHLPADVYSKTYKKQKELGRPAFCIVREPIARMQSILAYWKRLTGISEVRKLIEILNENSRFDINWTDPILHVMPQSWSIWSESGSVLCTCVIAFEKYAASSASMGMKQMNYKVARTSANKTAFMTSFPFSSFYAMDSLVHSRAMDSPFLCWKPKSLY